MNTFLAIIPIFLVIVAGYGLRALHIVKPSWISALNGFVYYVALPALIIQSFTGLAWREPAVGQALLANLGLVVVSAIVLATSLRLSRLSRKLQAAIFLVGLVGNTVYLGIPVAAATLPTNQPSLTAAISTVQLVASMVVALIAIEWIFLGSRNASRITGSLIRNPLMIALALGLILSFVPLPSSLNTFLNPALKLLAVTASPVALFALGAFLHGHARPRQLGLILTASSIKLIALPLLALFLLPFLGMHTAGLAPSVLLAAMPTAVTAFVLAETYKLDRQFAAAVMVATTIISLVTLPLIARFIG